MEVLLLGSWQVRSLHPDDLLYVPSQPTHLNPKIHARGLDPNIHTHTYTHVYEFVYMEYMNI